MSKNEFLQNLRRNLSGDLPIDEVESNISFYSDYISSPTPEEEERKIEEVGDPRLIAMNIIETYQMSHHIPHANRSMHRNSKYEDIYEKKEQEEESEVRQDHGIPFRYKLIGILSLVFVIAFVVVLVKALSVALRLFLPIILVFAVVYIFVSMIRR